MCVCVYVYFLAGSQADGSQPEQTAVELAEVFSVCWRERLLRICVWGCENIIDYGRCSACQLESLATPRHAKEGKEGWVSMWFELNVESVQHDA